MASKFSKQVQLVLACIVVICIVHLIIAALSPPSSTRRHFRLRLQNAGEDDVTGRVHFVHRSQAEDGSGLGAGDGVHSHMVARREILSQGDKDEPSDYLGTNNEEVPIPDTCNTCSLVGFSGHLLKGAYGGLIDQSDCVFRLGKAPTSGFEASVGRKTTFRILHSSTFYALLQKSSRLWRGPLVAKNYVVFGTSSSIHRLRSKAPDSSVLRTRLRGVPENVTVYFVSKKGEQNASKLMEESGNALGYDLGTHYYPSTLFFGIKAMSDAGCSLVRVYGVPDSRFCKRYPHSTAKSHYWEHYSPSMCEAGKDSGYNGDPQTPDAYELSIADRKALAGWSTSRSVDFSAPPWPQSSSLS